MVKNSNIKSIVLDILREVTQKDIQENDLEKKDYFSFLDSFSFIHFISLLEERLNMSFSPEEISRKDFKTNKGLYEIL